MTVRWRPYLWDEPQLVAPQEIEVLEREWGVRLPEDYKRVLASHQGMTPEPNIFDVAGGDDVFSVLLTWAIKSDRESYSLRRVHETLQPHVPAGIFPFARTPGGEYLCFDYRNASDEPRIVLVTVEVSVLPVADSIGELLEQLHEPPEVEA